MSKRKFLLTRRTECVNTVLQGGMLQETGNISQKTVKPELTPLQKLDRIIESRRTPENKLANFLGTL